MTTIKTLTANVREDVEKEEPLLTADKGANSSAIVEISLEMPQEIKNGTTI